jgi:FKBP-type peptidyl-prolyl cis-trans isomerase
MTTRTLLIVVPLAALASVAALAKSDDIPPPADVAAAPADAPRTPSGLATRVLQPGSGKQRPARPAIDDTVEVHYTGWTTDGKMFDSSVARGVPVRFPVRGVIKGWTEGLQLMVVGEKRRLWIPANLAYGDAAGGGRPAGMLVFDIELLAITSAPKAPADVAAPPKNAKRTKSGLAYRVLKKGTGKQHPTADSTVEATFTGWTTDGKMFDSSVGRVEPPRFIVNGGIAGWAEGLQLMVVGDKFRFWVPGKLAYDGLPASDMPRGMLVFDIELLSIR